MTGAGILPWLLQVTGVPRRLQQIIIITVVILLRGVPVWLALAIELVEVVLVLVLHLLVPLGRTPLVLGAAVQFRRKDLPLLLDEV